MAKTHHTANATFTKAIGNTRAEHAVPVELTIADNGSLTMSINGKPLSHAAVAYLIGYGFKQSLSDSYAGAKSEAEFTAAIESRIANIIAGKLVPTFDGSSRGARVDNVTAMARTLAANAIESALAAKGKRATRKETLAAAAKLVETNPQYREQAVAAIASAEAADSIDLDNLM